MKDLGMNVRVRCQFSFPFYANQVQTLCTNGKYDIAKNRVDRLRCFSSKFIYFNTLSKTTFDQKSIVWPKWKQCVFQFTHFYWRTIHANPHFLLAIFKLLLFFGFDLLLFCFVVSMRGTNFNVTHESKISAWQEFVENRWCKWTSYWSEFTYRSHLQLFVDAFLSVNIIKISTHSAAHLKQ